MLIYTQQHKRTGKIIDVKVVLNTIPFENALLIIDRINRLNSKMEYRLFQIDEQRDGEKFFASLNFMADKLPELDKNFDTYAKEKDMQIQALMNMLKVCRDDIQKENINEKIQRLIKELYGDDA